MWDKDSIIQSFRKHIKEYGDVPSVNRYTENSLPDARTIKRFTGMSTTDFLREYCSFTRGIPPIVNAEDIEVTVIYDFSDKEKMDKALEKVKKIIAKYE